MKNIIKIMVLSVFALTLFVSCEKESEDISKMVTYPVFDLTDGNFIVKTVETSSFVDPGVKAFSGDVEVPVTTSGTVDLSTPGLYILSYTAYDESELFSANAERKVLVVSQPLTEDYSGTYVNDVETSIVRTVSKPADITGWYLFSDSWWQAAAKIPVEFVDLGTSLKVIPGNSAFGSFDGTVTYDNSTNTLMFEITVAGITYKTNWIKQ